MIARRGIDSSWRRIDAATRSMSPASGVMRIACAISSCSACENRSIATQSAWALESAITSTSEGPATMSMPTRPNTRRFAAATYAFPGPTILSTAGTVAVPKASAATACAPPTRTMRSTPAKAAAASTGPLTTPSGVGVTMINSRTPATLAAMALMTTDEG